MARPENQAVAQPFPDAVRSLEPPGWKTALAWGSAIVLAVLFLVSGLWKITDAPGWAVRIAQAKVPHALSLPAALLVGITETVGGTLILIPRFRRWGALLIGALLLVFMVYFGINYNALRGADCSCFPWLKRVVGPGFFIGDGLMLLGALFAWIWSKPSTGVRPATLITAAIAVFALVSYGVAAARQTGTRAPDSITVDGKTVSLQYGRVMLYYFDPECMHCFDAAKRMSKLDWGETRVIAVPIRNPQFGPQFLIDTGFKAGLTPDFEKLKQVFPIVGAPAATLLENGREKAGLTNFDNEEPVASLRKFEFAR